LLQRRFAMSKVRVGINGFGRIGRQVLKAIIERHPDELEVVAINDLFPPETNAHLFKYDSNYGKYPGTVEVVDGDLVIDGQRIKVFAERDPRKLPWADLGVDIVIEATGLEDKVKGADLVITGEGGIDGQTIYGKTPIGVAKVAKKFGIPVLAVAGGISDDASVVYEHGIDGLMSIIPHPMTLEEAMVQGGKLVSDAAERIARLIAIGAELA